MANSDRPKTVKVEYQPEEDSHPEKDPHGDGHVENGPLDAPADTVDRDVLPLAEDQCQSAEDGKRAECGDERVDSYDCDEERVEKSDGDTCHDGGNDPHQHALLGGYLCEHETAEGDAAAH